MESITIQLATIGDEEVSSVNARELWQALESKQKFADWIKNHIEKYGFEENRDFFIDLRKSPNGRPAREYIITLDMAKELAMVENNEQGRKIRRYFIEVEKAYRLEVTKIVSRIENLEGKLNKLMSYNRQPWEEEQDSRELLKTALLNCIAFFKGANLSILSYHSYYYGNAQMRREALMDLVSEHKIVRYGNMYYLANSPCIPQEPCCCSKKSNYAQDLQAQLIEETLKAFREVAKEGVAMVAELAQALNQSQRNVRRRVTKAGLKNTKGKVTEE